MVAAAGGAGGGEDGGGEAITPDERAEAERMAAVAARAESRAAARAAAAAAADDPEDREDPEAARKRQRDEAAAALLEEEEREEQEREAKKARGGGVSAGVGENPLSRACPYVASVRRWALDFDFQKACSVSLSTTNVYACLVCGKYFQGRGVGTHAHAHALEEGHRIFMNVGSGKTYCLPEGYEVIDDTLNDIRFNRDPSFSDADIARLDKRGNDAAGGESGGGSDGSGNGGVGGSSGSGRGSTGAGSIGWTRSLDGTEFLPGSVGLNNIRGHDYMNVVVQALNRVTPLRNFLLSARGARREVRERAPLTWRLGELLRKMWNPRSFKGHVSPHEFAQEVITQSKKRFGLDAADPVEFLQWLLNFMHRELCAVDGAKSTIVSRCFRGELKVETLDEAGAVTNTQAVPFLMLGLDLPPQPLFQDALERNILPQVSLGSLLHKYNGVEVTEDPRQGRRRFSLRRLPPYLILHMKRFFKNNFFLEKNHTLVTFPMRALDVAEAVTPAVLRESANGTRYDLVANVCHEGKPKAAHTTRVHVQRKSEGPGAWYEMRDLNVAEILPQMLTLTEAYLQVWERTRAPAPAKMKAPPAIAAPAGPAPPQTQ